MEHTQMHLALKKGIKNFHYTRGIFSKFNFSLDKNHNGGYKAPSIL
jgi:hypothetical protein